MMKRIKGTAMASLVVSVFAVPAAMADHNSIWGEGWANMPNDTHDTRIDTLGDQEAFLDSLDIGSDSIDVGGSAMIDVSTGGSAMGGAMSGVGAGRMR